MNLISKPGDTQGQIVVTDIIEHGEQIDVIAWEKLKLMMRLAEVPRGSVIEKTKHVDHKNLRTTYSWKIVEDEHEAETTPKSTQSR